MRRVGSIAVLIVVASLLCTAERNESMQDLLARAEAASNADKPGLFLELADLELKHADDAFNAGDSAKGQAAVAAVVTYAERAGEAASISGKHLKNTEIHIRKIAKRLEDIRRSLSFDDRQPLQVAGDRLDHIRTQLLARMFEQK